MRAHDAKKKWRGVIEGTRCNVLYTRLGGAKGACGRGGGSLHYEHVTGSVGICMHASTACGHLLTCQSLAGSAKTPPPPHASTCSRCLCYEEVTSNTIVWSPIWSATGHIPRAPLWGSVMGYRKLQVTRPTDSPSSLSVGLP